MKRLHLVQKDRRGVAANNAKAERGMIEAAHGFKERGKALVAPIVADQEQENVTGRVAEPLPRCIPQSQAGSRREERQIDAIGHDDSIAPAKILGKLLGSVPGNSGETQRFAAVDAVLQEAEQAVVERAMKTAESVRRSLQLQLSQPMKDNVHEDEIGVGGIDAGRKDGVEAEMTKPPVEQAAESIGKHPEEKCKQVRGGQTGNAMPENALAGILFAICKRCDLQIVDPLRIEVNLMAVAFRKPFDDFGKGALCAMAPVYERREDGDAQVKSSLQRGLRQRPGNSLGHRQTVLEGERESRGRATKEN